MHFRDRGSRIEPLRRGKRFVAPMPETKTADGEKPIGPQHEPAARSQPAMPQQDTTTELERGIDLAMRRRAGIVDDPKDKALDAREQTGVSTDSLTAAENKQRVEHTPGPWQVVGPVGYIYTIGDPYGHGEMHVAQVRGWGHLTGTGGGCAFPEDKAVAIQNANATLIAAAPDLLAALKAIVEHESIDGIGIRYTFDFHSPFGKLARAAIAKAEGR